ncbi:hypothetical protein AB0I60_02780 [Actinosynnema sp. NPDC050436]|uniref:hypothetical protein n=1 Tax=Actinosynnema sp. NPDC050436 TaxID=3155659 RepID=UPI0033DDCEC6
MPRAPNRSGEVVAVHQPNPWGMSARKWDADGTYRPLETSAPGYFSEVSAINDAGQSVGYAGGPVRWSREGARTALPLPAGANGDTVRFINESGTAAGQIYLDNHTYATVWRP